MKKLSLLPLGPSLQADPTTTTRNAMAQQADGLRVIGAGCGRTGTASLKRALEILGFGPCYHMYEVVKNGHESRWIAALASPDTADWRGRHRT